MSSRVLLIGRSGCGKTSLIYRIHGKADAPDSQEGVSQEGVSQADLSREVINNSQSGFHKVNKTQAAVYHPGFIDVPGEYLEVRSLYRALIMLTCESSAIALLQAANDPQSLYPSGLARTFDKPVIGIVTKTDLNPADPVRATEILREAGAKEVFYTSALNNEGMDDLIKHLDLLRV